MDPINVYLIGGAVVFCILSFLLGVIGEDRKDALKFLVPISLFWPVVLFVGLAAGILYGTFSVLHSLGGIFSAK